MSTEYKKEVAYARMVFNLGEEDDGIHDTLGKVLKAGRRDFTVEGYRHGCQYLAEQLAEHLDKKETL